jgi:uncharacterized LabA/DUF88 family protein
MTVRLLLCSVIKLASAWEEKTAPMAVFSFEGYPMHRPIKTIVYIDGYNLYYGCLKDTPFKWLDIAKLFQRILHEQNPDIVIAKIKFFTAPALGKFASHGQDSSNAQQAYHRALTHQYPELIEIILGEHIQRPKPLPSYEEKRPFDKKSRSWVWLLEEKLTDVQIALTIYRDSIQQKCDQIILCSNDSDALPTLQALREDSPHTKIGLITPIREPHDGSEKSRRASISLEKLADWTRHYILDEELKNSLFPEKIPTRKKPIIKPSHW